MHFVDELINSRMHFFATFTKFLSCLLTTRVGDMYVNKIKLGERRESVALDADKRNEIHADAAIKQIEVNQRRKTFTEP